MDRELYFKSLVYVCESLTIKRSLMFDLNHLYEIDKFRYYKKAKENPSYDDEYLYEGTLEREVNIKRVLGILLFLEEDDALRLKMKKLMQKHYPEYFYPIKKKSYELLLKEMKRKRITPNWMLNNSNIRIPYFITYLLFSFATPPIFQELILEIENGLEETINWKPAILNLAEDSNSLEFIENNRKLFAKFQNCEDMTSFLDAFTNLKYIDNTFGELSSEFIRNILKNINFVVRLLDSQQLSATALLNSIPLTQIELDQILTAIILASKKDGKYMDIPENIVTMYYVLGVYFQTLIKEYKRVKEYFRLNNQETQFLELERLAIEVKSLKVELEKQNQKNRQLIISNTEWENRITKAKKDAEKGCYDEIHQLKKENDFFHHIQEEQIIRNKELHRLREFAFSIENEETNEQNVETSFELPDNERIIIVGGHENWQKKIKEAYPSLVLVDGTNPNLDMGLFKKSSLVLFFTPHMSHATYEKIVDYLSRNELRFDYLSEQNLVLFRNRLQKILQSAL